MPVKPNFSDQPPEKKLSFGKKCLFILIPILLFLAGLEGVLRATIGLKEIRYKCHYPVLDNQYCPNRVAIKDTNGEIIRSNSDGLLDKEYEKLPPQGTFRVAVLGDSFVAGEVVKDGYEFHALWEDELSRRFKRPVEFINFGVNGIGTWKEVQTYHLRARQYQPHLTVLAFYWGNDLSNSFVGYKRGGPSPLKDEYPVESFGQRLQVMRKSFNQWMWNNVALYQFTHTRARMLQARFQEIFRPEWQQIPDHPKQPASPHQPDKTEPPNNALLQQYPPLPGIPPKPRPEVNLPTALDDPWFFDSEAWELIKQLLLKLRQEVEADGGELIVIHFLSQVQYLERHDLPIQAFNTFLKQNKIGVIDPNPMFFKMSEEELRGHYVPNDIHFNEKGHQKLAQHSMAYMQTVIREKMPSAKSTQIQVGAKQK